MLGFSKGKRMTMSELIYQRYLHVDLKFFPWLAKVNAKNSKPSKGFKFEQHSHGSSDMGLQVEQHSHGSSDMGLQVEQHSHGSSDMDNDFFLGVNKIAAERFKEQKKIEIRETLALEAAKKEDHDDALRVVMGMLETSVLEEGEDTANENVGRGDDHLEDQRVINDNAKGQAYPGLEL